MRKRLEALGVLAAGLALGVHQALAGEDATKAAAPVIKSPTHEWNQAWSEILWDLWIIGGIFAIVAVYLLIRYRARSPDDVGTAPPLNLDKALAWSLVPAALFMADDFLLAARGWSLWNIQRQVPPGAIEIKVTGNQWFFEYDYGNGITESELTVPVGKPVVLRMTSNDVIHSFGLNEYRVKEDIMPGRVTYLWFYPDQPLETHVVCVEFCGNSHSQMYNKVHAVAAADYDAWMAKKLEKKKASLDASKAVAEAAHDNAR